MVQAEVRLAGSSSAGKDLTPRQTRSMVTRKATNTLDCSNRSITSRLSELTTPLYSMLVGSHLGEGTQFWDKYKNDIDNWSRFCKGQHLSHEEPLKELGLFSPEE